MTEKRFIIYTDQIDHWTIVGLDLLQEHTGRRLIVADIENILNDLYNENEELKKILKFLRNDNATDILNVLNSQENQIWELKKENEQLKKLLESKEKAHTRCDELYQKLYDENEQLRKDATTLIYANQDYRHENEQLKKILNELSDMLQFDVENGIRSYPVKLSEYLSNALKELEND